MSEEAGINQINSIVGAAFRAANDKRARSHQVELGMSALGGCRRQAGYHVTGTPMSNPPEERTDQYVDGREAMIGTLIHDLVLPQIKAMSMTAEIEVPLRLHLDGLPSIPGSADLVDQSSLLDLKGLALDTPIPTPTGWTTMAEIQVGDTVFDRSGVPCQVVETSEVKNLPSYLVSFRGADSIVCDAEHVWVARVGIARANSTEHHNPTPPKGPGVAEAYSIKELNNAWRDGRAISIPVTQSLVLPEIELPADPWVLGFWLGCGANPGQLTCQARDWSEIRLHLEEAGLVVSDDAKPAEGTPHNKKIVFDVAGLSDHLGEVATSRRVPAVFLRASSRQRLPLLQGLMDAGGHWNKVVQQLSFTSNDQSLAETVRELAASLGCRTKMLTTSDRRPGGTASGGTMRPRVAFDPRAIAPFRLKHKNDRMPTPSGALYVWHTVSGIAPAKPTATRCIAVDSPTRTFLAGRSMVVTHNTVGESSLSWVKKNGSRKQHIWQTHGYAQALIDSGHQIDDISLIYLNRSTGQVAHVHHQDFDPTVVDEIREWWREVTETDDPDTLPRDEYGPGRSFLCDVCPYLKRCWGEEARAGVPVGPPIEPGHDPDGMIEYLLSEHHEAKAAEKEAKIRKDSARLGLEDIPAGQYGNYELRWSGGGSYEQLDGAMAEQLLVNEGIEPPRVTRNRSRTANIKKLG